MYYLYNILSTKVAQNILKKNMSVLHLKQTHNTFLLFLFHISLVFPASTWHFNSKTKNVDTSQMFQYKKQTNTNNWGIFDKLFQINTLQSNTCLALDNYSMYNYVSYHKKCKQITKVVEQSPKNTGNQTHIFYVNYNNIVQISIFGVNI